MISEFHDTEYYPEDYPQVKALLGDEKQQAQKRYHGRTPAFIKVGRRVIYARCDFHKWLKAQRLEPNAA